ncbi:lipocalin family protein [Aquimarina gracilis]|uniref:Lipocalin family protein n=1 Tax=Aquimarina gracilis TaxID=874422 RepID=A0ABU5ZVS6_9FLAO|nr:lipocalin family protein [Aquimarina gracilis]MEB3345972.1 lipocalin family protein [Aquimarina gracilis]
MKKEQADKIILLGISLILAFIYSSYTVQSSDSDFVGCWIESFEKQTVQKTSAIIYKSCKDNSLIPTRRFRFKMELKKNRSCDYLSLAANDAHNMRPGTWSYDSKNCILTIKNSDNEIVKSFKVIEVKNNTLSLALRK